MIYIENQSDPASAKDIDDVFWVICDKCAEKMELTMGPSPLELGMGICDLCNTAQVLRLRNDYLQFEGS